MPFAESSYSETRRRTSDSYVKFTPEYRTVLRILDLKSKNVWKHWLAEANGGKGLTANCPNDQYNKICPVDIALAELPKDDTRVAERRARPRYMVNVLDRTPVTVCDACNSVTPGKRCISCKADVSKNDFAPLNRVKILEHGPRLFREVLNGVEKYQQEDFGVDITEYDITFTTQGTGREKKIAAVPQKPEPLDDAWLIDPETGEPQKVFNLDLLAEPSSVEEIEAMLRGATMEELNTIRGITK